MNIINNLDPQGKDMSGEYNFIETLLTVPTLHVSFPILYQPYEKVPSTDLAIPCEKILNNMPYTLNRKP